LVVKQDFQEAATWYRKTAEQGDPKSQNNPGVLRATGQGVPRDGVEVVRWYRLAAEQNDFEAHSNLAVMYLQGRGVRHDPERALQLCRKAAEGGYAVVQNNLALMYANGQALDRDYVWAYAWLDLASAEIAGAAQLRDRIGKEMAYSIVRAKDLAARKRHELEEKGRARK
jgi:TPR repeat protein